LGFCLTPPGCFVCRNTGWTIDGRGFDPTPFLLDEVQLFDQALGVPYLASCAEASQTIPFLRREITMPKVSLSGMTVEALMDLRKRVDEMLLERRAEIQKQIERMDRAIAVVGGARVVGGRGSVLKGRKVPPKYRGPSGETWAGRGAKPRWLVAAIKRGKKLEDFLIDKGRKKRRSKR